LTQEEWEKKTLHGGGTAANEGEGNFNGGVKQSDARKGESPREQKDLPGGKIREKGTGQLTRNQARAFTYKRKEEVKAQRRERHDMKLEGGTGNQRGGEVDHRRKKRKGPKGGGGLAFPAWGAQEKPRTPVSLRLQGKGSRGEKKGRKDATGF